MLRWMTPGWQETFRIPADRRSAAGTVALPQFLTRPDVASVLEIVEINSATPSPAAAARRDIAAPIAIETTVTDDAEYLLAIRYASGALRFVAPQEPAVRRAAKRARTRARTRTLLFQAPGGFTSGAEARRSIFADLTDVIDAILIRDQRCGHRPGGAYDLAGRRAPTGTATRQQGWPCRRHAANA